MSETPETPVDPADQQTEETPNEVSDTRGTFAQQSASEVVEPESALPEITLEELPESIQVAVRASGWTKLSPIQAKAIPYLLEGRDLMAQSRTGSGKTGAFILPLLAKLDPTYPHCQALVLVPTRELASQVHAEAVRLGKDSGINAVAVYGGVGYGAQNEAFRKGAQLVIGTPGRVLDHLQRDNFDLDDLEYIVFDEADRMMSMGFYPDMRQIKKHLPRERSGFMFSATFPPQVMNLSREFLNEPDFLSLSYGQVSVSNMVHAYYEVQAMDKDRSLIRIIEIENPSFGIIFANTKQKVNYLATVLQRFGYDADQLTADLSQRDRERVLDRIRAGNLRFLVATDVAARGIDISHLTHVFLVDVPDDHESYIHRAGRTGRAGASGTCISLVSYTEIGELNRIAARYNIELEKREVPTDETVAEVVSERLTALLEQKLREKDKIETERFQRFLPLARQLAERDGELEVMAMLLDEVYHQSLHAPVSEPEERAVPQAPKPKQGGGGGKGNSGGGRRRSPSSKRRSSGGPKKA